MISVSEISLQGPHTLMNESFLIDLSIVDKVVELSHGPKGQGILV